MTATLDILDRLIAFPTVSADSNLPMIDYLGDYLGARGFAVHRVTDRNGGKAGILASFGPSDRPGVMLSGHTDVVPVAGQDWSRDPFRLTRDGPRVYGRGTTDMKGFLAAMLSAADRASGRKLKAPLKLAFSWDEELGCLGLPQMLPGLDATIGKPALCIVGEPTSMQVATGHKGKVALRAVCTGMAGHSAMAPNYLNAIHLAADLVAALRRIQADLAATGIREDGYDIAYTTVHAGRIAGGTALNIVPDRAVLDFEFRYPAAQPAGPVHAAIADAVAAIEAAHRAAFPAARIEVATTFAYPGLGVGADDPTVAQLRQFVPGAGLTKVAFGTEAGQFAEAGIPTLVCGPGSMEQGHKPDEFIALSELAACDAMCDRVLDHLAG